jgi:hypothetical protein
MSTGPDAIAVSEDKLVGAVREVFVPHWVRWE